VDLDPAFQVDPDAGGFGDKKFKKKTAKKFV
jgi:hypothetical protein